MWSTEELADAMFEMGSLIIDGDDGSGDFWGPADEAFDMAESLTSGADLDDVRQVREDDLADAEYYTAHEYDEWGS